MNGVVTALRFVNLFAAGLLGGGLVMVLLGIIPTLRTFPAQIDHRVHLTFDRNADRFMPASGVVAGLTAILLLALDSDRTALGVAAYVVGLVGSVAIAVLSELYLRPTNRRFRSLSSDDLPPEYPRQRETWNRVHGVRTALGLLALSGYIVGALAARSSTRTARESSRKRDDSRPITVARRFPPPMIGVAGCVSRRTRSATSGRRRSTAASVRSASRCSSLASHAAKSSSVSHSLVITHRSGSSAAWQTWSTTWPLTPAATTWRMRS